MNARTAIVIAAIAMFIAVSFVTIRAPGANAGGNAPELQNITRWINSEPLTIAGLKGRVVLVDFWTYSCINCIRTLPHLEEWDRRYRNKGLVIIGVHSPEFAFEQDYANVKAAVQRLGVRYPVAMDNDHATWGAYHNNYWPRKYLIDRNGDIRYDHIGEGGYEETELKIQELLGEPANVTMAGDLQPDIGTPELYLGYAYARVPLGNQEGFVPGKVVAYQPPAVSQANVVYLSGSWRNDDDHVTAMGPAAVQLIYRAKDVNIVAGGNASAGIMLDHDVVAFPGADVTNGMITASGQRLYTIVAAPQSGTHVLELRVEQGFELYTFTFG